MNGVDAEAGWAFGGGLGGATVGQYGCKDTQIRRTSGFAIFGENDNWGANNGGTYNTLQKNFRQLDNFIHQGQAKPRNNDYRYKGLSVDLHSGFSNLAFADGHVETIAGRMLRFGYFEIQESWAAKYTAYTTPY